MPASVICRNLSWIMLAALLLVQQTSWSKDSTGYTDTALSSMSPSYGTSRKPDFKRFSVGLQIGAGYFFGMDDVNTYLKQQSKLRSGPGYSILIDSGGSGSLGIDGTIEARAMLFPWINAALRYSFFYWNGPDCASDSFAIYLLSDETFTFRTKFTGVVHSVSAGIVPVFRLFGCEGEPSLAIVLGVYGGYSGAIITRAHEKKKKVSTLLSFPRSSREVQQTKWKGGTFCIDAAPGLEFSLRKLIKLSLIIGYRYAPFYTLTALRDYPDEGVREGDPLCDLDNNRMKIEFNGVLMSLGAFFRF